MRHGDGVADAMEGVAVAIAAAGGNGGVAFVGWDVEPMESRDAGLV